MTWDKVLTTGYRAYDTTMNNVWDKINRGVCAHYVFLDRAG